MFNISHDQELIEEKLSLSIVKGQTSWLFGPNFLIYILEDELKVSKKRYSKVPSWKRDYARLVVEGYKQKKDVSFLDTR